MKKEVITEALKTAGVELEEAQLKDFIKAIQIANGEDIELAKKDYVEKEKALAELQAKYDEEVALKEKQQKEAEKTNGELEELRKFKNETVAQRTETAKKEAIEKLIGDDKYKFDKKAIKLLGIASKDRFTFNDKNEITNADDVMTALQSEYADYILTDTTTGATPQKTITNKKDVDVEHMSYEEYKAYVKSQENN